MVPADRELTAETLIPVAAERTMQSLEQATGVGEKGQKFARTLHEGVLKGGPAVRSLVDVLHGSWLGHPLHSVMTDFVVGAWTMGAVFDAIAGVTDAPEARYAGDRLAEIGTALAVPTALAGMADYSTIPKRAAGPASVHGMLNGCAFGLFLLSIRDRRNGNRSRGLLFSSLAQGLTLVSAWIGGELVYKHGVGVNHGESFTGPKEWTAVLRDEELREQEPRRVEVDGKGVLLYRENGRLFAIAAVCSHAGGPLEKGQMHEGCVQCPWHDSVFDLRNGNIVHGPATQPLANFDVRSRDGQIEIRLAESI